MTRYFKSQVTLVAEKNHLATMRWSDLCNVYEASGHVPHKAKPSYGSGRRLAVVSNGSDLTYKHKKRDLVRSKTRRLPHAFPQPRSDWVSGRICHNVTATGNTSTRQHAQQGSDWSWEWNPSPPERGSPQAVLQADSGTFLPPATDSVDLRCSDNCLQRARTCLTSSSMSGLRVSSSLTCNCYAKCVTWLGEVE